MYICASVVFLLSLRRIINFHISLSLSQGKDEVYDRMLQDYFLSYHQFIHLLCRVAINCEKFTETLVKLSKWGFVCGCISNVSLSNDLRGSMVVYVCIWGLQYDHVSLTPGVLIAYEGLPLHLALFPKLWTELCQSQVNNTHLHRRANTHFNTNTHSNTVTHTISLTCKHT